MSWLIWGILGSILFLSQLAKGASFSLVMPAAQTIGDLFIFVLAIRWGFGGFLKRDILALIGAALGLLLWYLTKEATIALFIAIFIDAAGAVLTVIKTYERPATETGSSWVLTFIGGLLACLAVGAFNPVLLAFPVYICLASGAILVAMRMGARKIFVP
jgi:hypothetical protein